MVLDHIRRRPFCCPSSDGGQVHPTTCWLDLMQVELGSDGSDDVAFSALLLLAFCMSFWPRFSLTKCF